MSKKEFMHVSTTVGKLTSAIPSINLPAIVTCRKHAPCTHDCYACKGNWLFPSVKTSLKNNLAAYKSNPKLFFDTVIVNTALYRVVRWHSSGDIVDMPYFEGMCRVARTNKGTEYLCFTKKFELVNEYIAAKHRIPKNLHIVFSAWEGFVPENPNNFPVTYVRAKGWDNSYIPEDAFRCAGECPNCLACWKLKKGQSVYFDKH